MFIKQSFSLFLFQIAADEVLHPVDSDLHGSRAPGRTCRPALCPTQSVKRGHETDGIVKRFSALCTNGGCFHVVDGVPVRLSLVCGHFGVHTHTLLQFLIGLS